jgi:16S rRNA (guanine(966)-N(2))-methyltransferase RsmD
MLHSTASDWSSVLDLYAGSGALGIEALSCGAGWCDFVEQNQRSYTIIKENLARTGFVHRAKVYCLDARRALPLLHRKYGIILLDPPYSDPSLSTILKELVCSKLVGEETTIVAEHWHQLSLEPRYGDFVLLRNLRHGDTCVSVYQWRGGEA